jgi:DMSO/TMAO reductase YedYZ molybdopterin-dependent catalytic subunit
MKKNRRYYVPVLVAGLALFLGSTPQDRTKEKVQNVEVKEYKGEKLDSIKNFEENSINGPQHIDITKYSLKIGGLVNKAVSYSYQDVLARPSVSKITLIHCVEGWRHSGGEYGHLQVL